MLEPESEDGLATWNYLDPKIQLDKNYPILKILEPPDCPTEIEESAAADVVLIDPSTSLGMTDYSI